LNKILCFCSSVVLCRNRILVVGGGNVSFEFLVVVVVVFVVVVVVRVVVSHTDLLTCCSGCCCCPGGIVETNGARNAFAFIRYKHPHSSATAIEAFNGIDWLDRRVRVQYCESPEMKNKRRNVRYVSNYNQFGAPQPIYYPRGMQAPPMFFGVCHSRAATQWCAI
jgi:uncharacterized protein (UPF0333 family)